MSAVSNKKLLVKFLQNYVNNSRYFIVSPFEDPDSNPEVKKLLEFFDKNYQKDLVVWTACYFAANILSIRDFERKGLKFHSLRYEDLIGKFKETFKKVAKFCEVPLEESEIGELPKEDSQRGSYLSKKKLKSLKNDLDQNQIKLINHVFKLCDISECENFVSYKSTKEETQIKN